MADDKPDPQQEALFREVDEDLRHEQLHRLWKKYGGILIGAAVMVVVVVAGYQGWQAWQHSVRSGEANAYEQALSADPQAAALQTMAAEASTGYAALARLQAAADLLEKGQQAEAVQVYQALYTDGGADPVFRDLARVLYVTQAMQLPDAEPKALNGVLTPLVDPANAYRHSALELQALLHLKQGAEADAVKTFTALADDATAPQGLRTRAEQMVAALGGVPAATDSEAAPTAGSSPSAPSSQ